MNLSHIWIFLIFISTVILFNTVTSFKTGTKWAARPTSISALESNHFAITTCALYTVAVSYLQQVYHIEDLEKNIQAKGGICNDPSVIIMNEIAKFNANPTYFRQAHQQIVLSNIATDWIYDKVPYTHIDDEEFENGSKFITMNLRAVQSCLARHEWVYARMALGNMFHTMQDFYSHSNWIELGIREPNRDLASGRRIGSSASKDIETCKSCNDSNQACVHNNLIVDKYLTTGYFSYSYPVIKPPGKCNHGYTCTWPGINSKYCEGITKDDIRSPHGHLHHQAASVAYDATVKVLNEIWQSSSTKAFGKLLGLSNSFSVVFVIDISEHLQSMIRMIQYVTHKLVDIIPNLSIQPNNYILAPFNGSHWDSIDIVMELDSFRDLIDKLEGRKLSYSSNNYYDALNEALTLCEPNSLVFFFTDAPAHEQLSQGLTRALARMKQTKIDVLFINHSQSVPKTIEELIHFTDVTGGLFVNMNIEQPKTIQQFIHHRLQETYGYEVILHESMSNRRRRGIFMLDATAKSVRIRVVSSNPSVMFYLINPRESSFRKMTSAKSDYLQVFNIEDNLIFGRWAYKCSDDCTIEVTIKTEFRCRTELHAYISNKLYIILATPPIAYENETLAITLCDKWDKTLSKSLELIGINGKILRSYPMDKSFVSKIGIPPENFRIRTVIRSSNGSVAYREEPALVDTTQILITIADQPLSVIFHDHINITYTIRNQAKIPLKIQLDIHKVLKVSKWYEVAANSIENDFIVIDSSQYTLEEESVRLVPLIFTLQAFGIDKNPISSEILFRSEQIIPLYVLNGELQLGDPTHFVVTP